MPSDKIAISVHHLTKTYRIFGHPGDRIKQAMTCGLRKYHREFTAVKDVSFDIKKGETIGIIGRNGSGKSTLLQLICGILKPTTGTVTVDGRVLALLELGAGFNPEFTGRENVYFQGALMGLSEEEMDARFSEIADFADIGEFIDQSVRMYSSGMFVKLAFAASVNFDPDILVVDEALAVGDVQFQERCFKRISAIREQGGTILIVTHSLEQVAHLCDRALLIDHGSLLAEGEATSTISRYLSMLSTNPGGAVSSQIPKRHTGERFCSHPAYNQNENRWGDRAATIEDILIIQDGKEDPKLLVPGRIVELQLKIDFHIDVQRPIYGLAIKSLAGALVLNTNSRQLQKSHDILDQYAGDTVYISFFFEPFLDGGMYLLSFGVVSEQAFGIVPHDRRYDSIVMKIDYPRAPDGSVIMNPGFSRVRFS
ncbi:MAG: ABC transporter ATP-binding protein [Candidatus Sedimenticola sp. (ex Thyasira tokunagai)]